jgi:hypothetical protein
MNEPANAKPAGHPLLSLLIFIHLFCVGIALWSAHFPSALQVRLLDRLSPYLRLLHFDLNFTPFYLTQGTVDDQDHRIEVRGKAGDGGTAADWRSLPDSGWRAGERYKRYARLAAAMAFFAEREQDAQTALFARAVAEHYLNQGQVEPVEVRCRRILPQDRSQIASGTAEERDPYSDTYLREVYRANTIVEGSSVSVVKVEETREVASPRAPGAPQP